MKATEAAWAAGFFDGEGCVSLHLQHGKRGRLYPHVTLVIAQKDRRPIEHFHKLMGAKEKIGLTMRTTFKRPYYRVTYSGTRAGLVLRTIRPYLTLKAEVADVALELQNDIESLTRSQREAGVPPERIEYRKALIEKGKWLNTGRWAAAETKSTGTVQ